MPDRPSTARGPRAWLTRLLTWRRCGTCRGRGLVREAVRYHGRLEAITTVCRDCGGKGGQRRWR